MKKFFAEFKKFITRGNVVDMAVGVIVGSSFTAIVNGMSNNILKPIINWLLALFFGANSLSEVYTFLKPAYLLDANGVPTAEIDLANSIYIDWGAFINAVINFLIVAFALFCIVKIVNRVKEKDKAFKESLKPMISREDRKEMKKRGIKAKDSAAVAAYFAEKAQKEAEAKAAAEEKARLERIYSSTQIIPIILALGTGIGSEFDITKLRYGKIVIMADADVDGAHIKTLLLTFFFRHMRPLIENGHIFAAQPPLYKVYKGKQQRYAFSDEERDVCIAELGQGAQAERYKGLGEMDAEQLWETTMDPERRTLKRVTIEDALMADALFSVLMGDKVEPRREFIEMNAKYAENIDV